MAVNDHARGAIRKEIAFHKPQGFILRTPALPASALAIQRSAPEVAPENLLTSGEDAWNGVIARQKQALSDITCDPFVLQALYIASPSLYDSLEHWRKNPHDKKGRQTERALVRYLSRMSYRCTPFGLFSGCSFARVPSESVSTTVLQLESSHSYRIRTRLDFDYLFALARTLQSDSAIRLLLKYYPNSSLYRCGNSWRYIQINWINQRPQHSLVKLISDPILDRLLTQTSQGLTPGELRLLLRTMIPETDASEGDITSYIDDLIDSNVLVSSLSLPVTGRSPLDSIISELPKSSGSNVPDVLAGVYRALADIDEQPVGLAIAKYQAIEKDLAQLDVPVNRAKLFQTDLFKSMSHADISSTLLDELTECVNILHAIGTFTEPTMLASFRSKFVTRYERAWVPLLEVLDEDSGIGLDRDSTASLPPILRDIPVNPIPANEVAGMRSVDAFLLKQLQKHSAKTSDELVLDSNEVLSLGGAQDCIPSSFSLLATIVASGSKSLTSGDYQLYLRTGFGPSSARMVGRFLDSEPALLDFVRKSLEVEESIDPDAIFCEIAHLPEGRVGNILFRPILRKNEIVYLGRSGLPESHQIPAHDLLVTVTAYGEILLFSKRLGKRIVPRLSSAHAFSHKHWSLVYRFLCMLQNQHGVGVPLFSWGPLEVLPELPRLRVGNVILSPARWRLSKDDIVKLTSQEGYPAYIGLNEFRRTRNLPRWVVLTEGDNALPVDLDSPMSVDAFLHVLKRSNSATLQEMLPKPDELCVDGPEGCYFHEMLVPFERKLLPEQAKDSPLLAARNIAMEVARCAYSVPDRVSGLGGDWLYFKLYGSAAMLDLILVSVFSALRSAIDSGGEEIPWFFVQYSDPDNHLRLRFKVIGRRRQELIANASKIFDRLLEEKAINRVSLDTYVREVERYGGPNGVGLAEKIFWADSFAVLTLIMNRGEERQDPDWWLVAVLGVDKLLDDFNLSDLERMEALIRVRDGRYTEFRFTRSQIQGLARKYRAERVRLQDILSGKMDNVRTFSAHSVFAQRSATIKDHIQNIRDRAANGQITTPIQDIVLSVIHMHINRMVRVAQRSHELMIYHFLAQHYISKCARASH